MDRPAAAAEYLAKPGTRRIALRSRRHARSWRETLAPAGSGAYRRIVWRRSVAPERRSARAADRWRPAARWMQSPPQPRTADGYARRCGPPAPIASKAET